MLLKAQLLKRHVKRTLGTTIAAAAIIGAGIVRVSGDSDSDKMVKPRYAEDKQLLLPEAYRTWTFVGASIGLSYSEQSRTNGPGSFHHVYVQPEAYAHYRRTGTFPEKTMFVMEVHAPEQKVSINKQGYFEGERVGLEVSVKDHDKFEEGWAYFDFANGRNKQSKAFPKASCFDCHQEHGASDNVFTQFYPVLREAKKSNPEPPKQ